MENEEVKMKLNIVYPMPTPIVAFGKILRCIESCVNGRQLMTTRKMMRTFSENYGYSANREYRTKLNNEYFYKLHELARI